MESVKDSDGAREAAERPVRPFVIRTQQLVLDHYRQLLKNHRSIPPAERLKIEVKFEQAKAELAGLLRAT